MTTLFARESHSPLRSGPSGVAVILNAVTALIWTAMAIGNFHDHHNTRGGMQILCAVLYTVLSILNTFLWLRKRKAT